MEFDELNINILTYVYISKECTTSQITKNILYSTDTNDFRKNDSIIRYRLKEMVKNGLMFKTKDNRAKYSLNTNFIVEGNVDNQEIKGILFLVNDKYPILIGFNKELIKSI